jgi:N-acetylmuramoyl-L-alanine amidase
MFRPLPHTLGFVLSLSLIACAGGGGGGSGPAANPGTASLGNPNSGSQPNGLNSAPSIQLAAPLSTTDPRSGEIMIPLQINDVDNDPIQLFAEVQTPGAAFQPASLDGKITGLDNNNDHRVAWMSLEDAEHIQGSIILRITASDGASTGLPLEIPLSLDNVAPTESFIQPSGSLNNKTIIVSPGHGYHYSVGAWRTQRGLTNGLIEDFFNAESANDYLIPVLEGMGAEVYSVRERSRCPVEIIVDNSDSGYSESGSWSSSSLTGFQDGITRYATGSTSGETARATFRPTITQALVYPVWIRYRASSNRASDMLVRVRHAGGLSLRRVDASRNDDRWIYIGEFPFLQGNSGNVTISNLTSQSGKLVVADAVRFGAGQGDVLHDVATKPSGHLRWQECSVPWINYVGCPTSVVPLSTRDLHARTLYAGWQGGDAYIGLHSNAGGGTGTSSFVRTTSRFSGSDALQDAVHGEMIKAVREQIHPLKKAPFDTSWVDRGQKTANFAELNGNAKMPATLVEVAFHDSTYDSAFELDDRWRELMYRGIAKGLMRFFNPNGAVLPLRPTEIKALVQNGNIIVSWNSTNDNVETSAQATGGWVQISRDGFSWSPPRKVSGLSVTFDNLLKDSPYYFRVRSTNAGGVSLPGEIVAARISSNSFADKVLVVGGHDRLDKNQTIRGGHNRFDSLVRTTLAIHDTGRDLSISSCQNEAVEAGAVGLGLYRVVVWTLGTESTVDETFSNQEQSLVSAYLAGGGGLFVSGSEIAWDLGQRGSSADQSFLSTTLGVTYDKDASGTYNFIGVGSFGGISSSFDDGSQGTYNVEYADVLKASSGSTEVLRYSNGLGSAGVAHTGSAGKVVVLGFPLETVPSRTDRDSILSRAFDLLF